MKRYTPAQQEAYIEQMRKNPPPPAMDDVPHIVFPKDVRFIADFDMTHEQMEAVSQACFAADKMRAADEALKKVMPPGTWWQYFGKWSLLRLSTRDPG